MISFIFKRRKNVIQKYHYIYNIYKASVNVALLALYNRTFFKGLGHLILSGKSDAIFLISTMQLTEVWMKIRFWSNFRQVSNQKLGPC